MSRQPARFSYNVQKQRFKHIWGQILNSRHGLFRVVKRIADSCADVFRNFIEIPIIYPGAFNSQFDHIIDANTTTEVLNQLRGHFPTKGATELVEHFQRQLHRGA